jgi:hypothetical protein
VKTDVAQGLYEARRHLVQFASVITREAAEDLPSLARDAKNGAAAVIEIGNALQKALALRAINEFDGAVVLEPKTLGCVSNGDDGSVGRSGNLEEELMPLRVEASLKRGGLTEEEESTQFEAEVCQGGKQRICAWGWGVEKHAFISYHDI